jgi:hypothetical protein
MAGAVNAPGERDRQRVCKRQGKHIPKVEGTVLCARTAKSIVGEAVKHRMQVSWGRDGFWS